MLTRKRAPFKTRHEKIALVLSPIALLVSEPYSSLVMKGKGKKLASVLIIDTSGGLPVAGPVGYVIFGPCGDGILTAI